MGPSKSSSNIILDEQELGPGKQNVTAAGPKDNLEFKPWCTYDHKTL